MAADPTSSIRKNLVKLATRWQQRQLRDEFLADPDRFHKFSMKLGGLFADYSKNHVDEETLAVLLDFAEAAAFPDWRQRMFSGEAINNTENRAAWHVALRDTELLTDVLRDQVESERSHEAKLARDVRDSEKFTTLLNIGIGGSHLGPEMVCEALSMVGTPKIKPHFISNTDPRSRGALLATLDPLKTLVIIASKSFTTIETRINAGAILDWLTENGKNPQRIGDQVIAISANNRAVTEMGITESNQFGMHDWIGGRYSMWSCIGLPIAIAFGHDALVALRNGAKLVDRNFLESEPRKNLALLLGLLDVWYAEFFSCSSRAILPYNAALQSLPGFVQQLMMESGGKSVQRNGKAVVANTAPVVWGGMGQAGQHAYYQLLHQGTHMIPVDFIFAMDQAVAGEPGYETLAANFIAQSDALMRGVRDIEVKCDEEDDEIVAHRVCLGNRPSSSIVMDQLDAFHIGQLAALYEHRTFVQGVCWNINPFDQMGVELGKRLAGDIRNALHGKADYEHDSSTTGLVAMLASLFRRGQ